MERVEGSAGYDCIDDGRGLIGRRDFGSVCRGGGDGARIIVGWLGVC